MRRDVLVIFTVGLLAPLSGCASIKGFNTSTSQDKELVRTEEKVLPIIEKNALEYDFESRESGDWLNIKVSATTYEPHQKTHVYRMKTSTTRKFKKETGILQDLLGVGAGALIYWLGNDSRREPGENLPFKDTGAGKSWRTAGLVTAGLFGLGLGVDCLQYTRSKTVSYGEEEISGNGEPELKVVTSKPFANQECHLVLVGAGDKTFKTDANGKAEVKVSDIKGFSDTLNRSPWAYVRFANGAKSCEVRLSAPMREVVQKANARETTAKRKRCHSRVNELITQSKWQTAYKALDECDKEFGSSEMSSALRRKIAGHVRIKSRALALSVVGEPSESAMMLVDPVGNKNELLEFPSAYFQRTGDTSCLVKVSDMVVRVEKASNSDTPFEFVTGHPVKTIGVILGIYTYTTTSGGTNTVPRVKAYWMESMLKGY